MERQAPEVFAIEHILDRRERKGRAEYLIKWMGYDKAHNSWEPAANIFDRRFIDEYDRAREEALASAAAGKASGAERGRGARPFVWPPPNSAASLLDPRSLDSGRLQPPLLPRPRVGKRAQLGDTAEAADPVEPGGRGAAGAARVERKSDPSSKRFRLGDVAVLDGVHRPRITPTGPLTKRQQTLEERGYRLASDRAGASEHAAEPEAYARRGQEPAQSGARGGLAWASAAEGSLARAGRAAPAAGEGAADDSLDPSAGLGMHVFPCGAPVRPWGLQCPASMHCASAHCSKGRPPHNTCQSRKLGASAIGLRLRVRSLDREEGAARTRAAVVTSWDPALGTHELLYDGGQAIQDRVCLGSARVQIVEQAAPMPEDDDSSEARELDLAAAAVVSATERPTFRFGCACGVTFDHGNGFWSSSSEMLSQLGDGAVSQCAICATYVHAACAVHADLSVFGVVPAARDGGGDGAGGAGGSARALCLDCSDLAADAGCCTRAPLEARARAHARPIEHDASGQVLEAVLALVHAVEGVSSTTDRDGATSTPEPAELAAFACGLCWACAGARGEEGEAGVCACMWRPDGDYTYGAVLIDASSALRSAAEIRAAIAEVEALDSPGEGSRPPGRWAAQARGIVHACEPVDQPGIAGALGLGARSCGMGASRPRLETRVPIRARVHFDNGVVAWLSESQLLRFARAPRSELAYSSLAARQLSQRQALNAVDTASSQACMSSSDGALAYDRLTAAPLGARGRLALLVKGAGSRAGADGGGAIGAASGSADGGAHSARGGDESIVIRKNEVLGVCGGIVRRRAELASVSTVNPMDVLDISSALCIDMSSAGNLTRYIRRTVHKRLASVQAEISEVNREFVVTFRALRDLRAQEELLCRCVVPSVRDAGFAARPFWSNMCRDCFPAAELPAGDGGQRAAHIELRTSALQAALGAPAPPRRKGARQLHRSVPGPQSSCRAPLGTLAQLAAPAAGPLALAGAGSRPAPQAAPRACQQAVSQAAPRGGPPTSSGAADGWAVPPLSTSWTASLRSAARASVTARGGGSAEGRAALQQAASTDTAADFMAVLARANDKAALLVQLVAPSDQLLLARVSRRVTRMSLCISSLGAADPLSAVCSCETHAIGDMTPYRTRCSSLPYVTAKSACHILRAAQIVWAELPMDKRAVIGNERLLLGSMCMELVAMRLPNYRPAWAVIGDMAVDMLDKVMTSAIDAAFFRLGTRAEIDNWLSQTMFSLVTLRSAAQSLHQMIHAEAHKLHLRSVLPRSVYDACARPATCGLMGAALFGVEEPRDAGASAAPPSAAQQGRAADGESAPPAGEEMRFGAAFNLPCRVFAQQLCSLLELQQKEEWHRGLAAIAAVKSGLVASTSEAVQRYGSRLDEQSFHRLAAMLTISPRVNSLAMQMPVLASVNPPSARFAAADRVRLAPPLSGARLGAAGSGAQLWIGAPSAGAGAHLSGGAPSAGAGAQLSGGAPSAGAGAQRSGGSPTQAQLEPDSVAWHGASAAGTVTALPMVPAGSDPAARARSAPCTLAGASDQRAVGEAYPVPVVCAAVAQGEPPAPSKPAGPEAACAARCEPSVPDAPAVLVAPSPAVILVRGEPVAKRVAGSAPVVARVSAEQPAPAVTPLRAYAPYRLAAMLVLDVVLESQAPLGSRCALWPVTASLPAVHDRPGCCICGRELPFRTGDRADKRSEFVEHLEIGPLLSSVNSHPLPPPPPPTRQCGQFAHSLVILMSRGELDLPGVIACLRDRGGGSQNASKYTCRY